MRVRLVATSKVADRYNVSNTVISAIASSVLEYINIVTPDNLAIVIDRSKVQKERIKTRMETKQNSNSSDLDFISMEGMTAHWALKQ